MLVGRLVYPVGIGPVANDDLPPDIRVDYDEARSIAAQSPRAAAALLRLAIDKLTARLAPEHADKRLFDRIGAMVGAGLGPSAQLMLDYVRLVGNGAVHERVDIPATPEQVAILFGLLNDLCDQLLTRPRKLAELWATVPESQRTAAEDRDAKVLAARSEGDAA